LSFPLCPLNHVPALLPNINPSMFLPIMLLYTPQCPNGILAFVTPQTILLCWRDKRDGLDCRGWKRKSRKLA
jgi:hypothetical protein